jgi:hypothetical protein
MLDRDSLPKWGTLHYCEVLLKEARKSIETPIPTNGQDDLIGKRDKRYFIYLHRKQL